MSLMSCTMGRGADDRDTFHLDPWHKIVLGWVGPRVYDLRGPGNCVTLKAPPALGDWVERDHRPVLLYDASRGRNEYFIVEFRNPEVVPYDRDARDSGVAVWYVQTDGGPTRLAQVPLQGRNGGATEPANFLVNAPDGSPFAARGNTPLWRNAHGTFALEWLDRSDSGVRLRVEAFARDATELRIEWGYEAPFCGSISRAAPSIVRRGGRLILEGTFGVEEAGRVVSLSTRTRFFDLPVLTWTSERIEASVPRTVPDGHYDLVIFSDASGTKVSNAVCIDVRG